MKDELGKKGGHSMYNKNCWSAAITERKILAHNLIAKSSSI